MRVWFLLLGGLVVWAAHFFVLYAIASTLPGHTANAGALVLAATAAATIVDALILWRASVPPGDPQQFDRWVRRLAQPGAAISLVAVLWQASPIFFIS